MMSSDGRIHIYYKNGYGDMFLMRMETYEKTLGKLELYEKLAQAEKQMYQADSFLEAEQVFEKVKEKYGK